MEAHPARASFASTHVWPIMRAVVLQLVLMSSIAGNLVGILVLTLLVDQLHWLNIDFHGKTTSTIAADGKVLGLSIVFLVNLVLVVLAWRFLERRPLGDMFWTFRHDQWRMLGWGLLAGLAEVLLVFGVLVAAGVAHVTWGLTQVSGNVIILALGWVFASSVLGPLAEEVLNRGYWLQNVRLGWGLGAAVVVTAVLFGAAHLLNPNAEWLGAVNIALSAAIWALAAVWLRSLWFPIGWHAAWNFTQFFVAGLPNSGFSVAGLGLQGTTLLATAVDGPNWLTGGAFGLEASIVKTVLLLGALATLIWLKRRNRA